MNQLQFQQARVPYPCCVHPPPFQYVPRRSDSGLPEHIAIVCADRRRAYLFPPFSCALHLVSQATKVVDTLPHLTIPPTTNCRQRTGRAIEAGVPTPLTPRQRRRVLSTPGGRKLCFERCVELLATTTNTNLLLLLCLLSSSPLCWCKQHCFCSLRFGVAHWRRGGNAPFMAEN